MFSDFILEEQPTTVEDTFQVFKDISKNFGNRDNDYKYSSPMYAQLIPINVVRFNFINIKLLAHSI